MPAVGSHNTKAQNGGTWKSWSNFWAKHSGTWKKPLGVYVKSSGSWVKVWDERPVITNVSTSYVYDPYQFPPTYTYYKNFDVTSNGFDTSLSATTPNPFGTYLSQTSVSANNTVYVTSETVQLGGSYDPAQYPTITATNSSGSVTF
jgi:hypothetical protein